MNTTVSRASVEADIKETLGLVPHFFSAIPDELLAPEWQIFKRIELGQTLIPNKYKELIGVGLHAETKCHYCTLFHTEAAKLFGATDEEIQEAVHYAKTSLGWSAYINGMQEDYDGFSAELALIGEAGAGPADRAAGNVPRPRARSAHRGGSLRCGASARRHAR